MSKIKITAVVGDLTKQPDCEAIVNSANPSMLKGSGVWSYLSSSRARVRAVWPFPRAFKFGTSSHNTWI